MKIKKQYLTIISLVTVVATFQGCVQKQADGTYPSVYSYHSYNNITATKKNIHTRVANQYRPYRYQRLPKQRIYSNKNNNLANKIAKIAKSHLGQTYVWGATGPYTFDCSGFTKSVFKYNGIIIPRVSKEQAKVGKYISRNQLQKGDLIFFDSKKSSTVSHVGIYLGNGAFIHASSAKKRVVIGNLNSGYHSKHFKWGRRLTPRSNIYARR